MPSTLDSEAVQAKLDALAEQVQNLQAQLLLQQQQFRQSTSPAGLQSQTGSELHKESSLGYAGIQSGGSLVNPQDQSSSSKLQGAWKPLNHFKHLLGDYEPDEKGVMNPSLSMQSNKNMATPFADRHADFKPYQNTDIDILDSISQVQSPMLQINGESNEQDQVDWTNLMNKIGEAIDQSKHVDEEEDQVLVETGEAENEEDAQEALLRMVNRALQERAEEHDAQDPESQGQKSEHFSEMQEETSMKHTHQPESIQTPGTGFSASSPILPRSRLPSSHAAYTPQDRLTPVKSPRRLDGKGDVTQLAEQQFQQASHATAAQNLPRYPAHLPSFALLSSTGMGIHSPYFGAQPPPQNTTQAENLRIECSDLDNVEENGDDISNLNKIDFASLRTYAPSEMELSGMLTMRRKDEERSMSQLGGRETTQVLPTFALSQHPGLRAIPERVPYNSSSRSHSPSHSSHHSNQHSSQTRSTDEENHQQNKLKNNATGYRVYDLPKIEYVSMVNSTFAAEGLTTDVTIFSFDLLSLNSSL